jgi:hypothetical protein
VYRSSYGTGGVGGAVLGLRWSPVPHPDGSRRQAWRTGPTAVSAPARLRGPERPVAAVAVLQGVEAGGFRPGIEDWWQEGGEAVRQETRRMAHAFRRQSRRKRSLHVVGGDASFQPDGHRRGEAANVALG